MLLLFVYEPQRGQSEPMNSRPAFSAQQHTTMYSLKQSFFLLLNRPYLLLCIASAVRMFSGYALGAWLATFYERHFDLDSAEYGVKVGLIVIFGGCSGSLIGSRLS